MCGGRRDTLSSLTLELEPPGCFFGGMLKYCSTAGRVKDRISEKMAARSKELSYRALLGIIYAGAGVKVDLNECMSGHSPALGRLSSCSHLHDLHTNCPHGDACTIFDTALRCRTLKQPDPSTASPQLTRTCPHCLGCAYTDIPTITSRIPARTERGGYPS